MKKSYHHAGSPVEQRTVRNVSMTGDPTNISGAEVNIIGVIVEGVVVRG